MALESNDMLLYSDPDEAPSRHPDDVDKEEEVESLPLWDDMESPAEDGENSAPDT